MYDVAILGAGVGGTLLAAILARHGQRVLIVEQGTHPRFTIGESTIPETTILLRLMARRYQLPEILHLCNFQQVRAHVSSACGVKRNFSFVHHRAGEPHREREITQFFTLAPPLGPDVHYFRQDIDAYMLAVAARRGATVRQQTDVQAVELDADGVTLRLGGQSVRARYVVDAGGIRAPLARMHDLRIEPCPMATRSRTLYTHMVGVTPFDRIGPPPGANRPSPFCQGTLHHLFEGGWMWVIPFDNHAASTNPLCSVGLTLDVDRWPRTGEDAAVEFRRVVDSFPSVARQLAGAGAVRPWIATDRLQYQATRFAGDRWCLLPHAGSFVDPLFSSGLAITMCAVNMIAWRLIQACADGDYSGARFQPVDDAVRRSFGYYDTLVSRSYRSWKNFELWNAWHRLWMLGSLYGVSGLFEVLSEHERTGDPSLFMRMETPPYRGVQGLDFAPLQELFAAAAAEVDAAHEGRAGAGEAAARIYSLLRESGLAPAPWRLDDPERRCPGTLTFLPMLRLFVWGRYRSPAAVRRHYFMAGRTGGLVRELVAAGGRELARAARSTGGLLRDAFVSWNDDWDRPGPVA